jgi:RNA polymerase sigma factor (sigma-70 family)
MSSLPYGQTVEQLYNDHKGLIYKYAHKHLKKWSRLRTISEALSDAYMIFIESIKNFDPSESAHGNTKYGFYIHLRSQLEYGLKGVRREYYKAATREVSESRLDPQLVTKLFGESVMNSDYGRTVKVADSIMDITKILSECELDDRYSTVLRHYYGLITEEKETLRSTAEFVGISHERVRQIINQSEKKIHTRFQSDINLFHNL